MVSQREYAGTGKSDLNLISYTDFKYADKTNYLTGITHFSPLGRQEIGYAYGSLKNGEMPDQVYSVQWNGSEKLGFAYDNFGRLAQKNFGGNSFGIKYAYENYEIAKENGAAEKRTTTLVKSVETPAGTYSYEYDKLGNIVSVANGTTTVSYEYDSLNQLTRVNDEKAGKTITYSYTNGNITEQKEYEYTTGELGEPTDTKTWSYTDSVWSDLLTDFNGTQIAYDEIGNPLSIGSKQLTWLGRQLQSIADGENIIEYAYNGDGNRISKTVNGVKTEFIYNGDILAGQITGDDKIVFMYDNNSDIFGFVLNGTEYYYIKNAQNDVTAIADKDGNVLANYAYDSWGKVTEITGNTALAEQNPIRYRSYYFDFETEWYFLNTRYYSPDMCRFINADGYVQTGQSVLDKNMFAYCLNNPANMLDQDGDCPHDGKFYTSGPFVGQFKYNSNCRNCRSHGEFWIRTPDGKQVNMMGSESHRYKQMAICTDGGKNSLGSKTHQNKTAYTINGEYLDPVKIRYVVAPVFYDSIKNGSSAMVIDHKTGKYVMAIVGDRGPEGKFNESSVSVAWDLGYDWADGSRGPSGDFETIYFNN